MKNARPVRDVVAASMAVVDEERHQKHSRGRSSHPGATNAPQEPAPGPRRHHPYRYSQAKRPKSPKSLLASGETVTPARTGHSHVLTEQGTLTQTPWVREQYTAPAESPVRNAWAHTGATRSTPRISSEVTRRGLPDRHAKDVHDLRLRLARCWCSSTHPPATRCSNC